MKSILFLILLVVLVVVGVFAFKASVRAENISTTVYVGVAELILEGYTCPGCNVTFTENNATIGTTVADATNGFFRKSYQALTPGVHDISLYATDLNGDVSTTITESANLVLGSSITVTNIIIPPSVADYQTSMASGTPITLSGYGVAGGTLYITVPGTGLSVSVGIGATNGEWSYSLPTSSLGVGNYGITFLIQIIGGYQSEESPQYPFSITSVPGTSGGDSTSTTVNPTPTPGGRRIVFGRISIYLPDDGSRPTVSIPFFRLFVLDGNGKIDRTDLVTALKTWVDYWRGKIDGKENCDLNRDNYCDIYDFSILLFSVA